MYIHLILKHYNIELIKVLNSFILKSALFRVKEFNTIFWVGANTEILTKTYSVPGFNHRIVFSKNEIPSS